MISIVVGVSLVPTIVESINTAKTTPNAPIGMPGLLDVLVYVRKASLGSNLQVRTSQIRGKLNQIGMLIPSQAGRLFSWACVETRWFASHWDEGIVHSFRKVG